PAPAPAPAPAAAAAPPAPAAASAVRPPVQVAAPAAAPVAAPTAVPPAAPALASLPAAAAKPGPASNAFGFRVGDRWNYQTVDKYKAEVIENWSRRIGSIAPDGSLLTTTGTLLSPEGNERKTSNRVFQSRTFDSANIMIPRNLSVGHRENFKFTERSTRLDGTEIEQSWSGTLEVVRTERVRVPAGEFEALRIERKASVDGREPGSVRTWSGTLEQVLWYVPQVRSYVANDFTFRPRLGAADRFRVELTSYEVAPGPVALAR
ncbi:hypothetical protein ACT80S_06020, partial [Ramlibacter sp. MAHUQ-53]|uniref:hypothetical protein n=1 Tax=unclassified Ramlibacter TaxID=2617605 RepID=UPI003635756D